MLVTLVWWGLTKAAILSGFDEKRHDAHDSSSDTKPSKWSLCGFILCPFTVLRGNRVFMHLISVRLVNNSKNNKSVNNNECFGLHVLFLRQADDETTAA